MKAGICNNFICLTFHFFSGFGNELTVNVKNVSIPQRGKASPNGSLTPDSSSYVDEKTGNLFSAGECAIESEFAYTHSEDESARSPRGSPAGRDYLESPSQQFSDDHFGKSTEVDAETHRYGFRNLFLNPL